MRKTEIIGRVMFQMDYNKADAILKQFRPILNKPTYVKKIFDMVQSEFQDESPENRRLIFIGTVYQAYQPLSFLENKEEQRVQGKLPAGVRDEMARCLEFVNPEMCNHFKTFVEPHMKPDNNGVERPFKAKVMSIIEKFRPFSIHADELQTKLSL